MANSILVVAEQTDGALRKVSFEMQGEAGRLAEKMGATVEAALLGSGEVEKLPMSVGEVRAK